MAGMCKITLVGTLLNQPQSSQTNSGSAITRFDLGVERESRGQGDPVLDVYTVAIFGMSGEELLKRVNAGEIGVGFRLLVMGRFEFFETTDGRGPQFQLEVTADEIFDLGMAGDGMLRSLAGGAPSRVIFYGNLGGEPESRQIPSGVTVADLSVAVSRWVPRDQQPNTNWFRVSAWRNMAERVNKLAGMGMLGKGQRILVEGALQPREWVDNNGQRRMSLDVTMRDFELGAGSEQGGDSVGGGSFAGQGGSRSGNDHNSNRGGGDPFTGGGRSSGNDDSFGNRGGGYSNQGGGRSGRSDENFGNQGGGVSSRGGSRSGQNDDFGNQDLDDIPF